MGVSFDAEWQLASRIECGRLPSTKAFLSTATMRFRLNFTFSYCHEEGAPIARFFGALNRFSIHLTIALAGESPAPIVYPFQPSPQYSMDLHSLHISILLVCSWIPPLLPHLSPQPQTLPLHRNSPVSTFQFPVSPIFLCLVFSCMIVVLQAL